MCSFYDAPSAFDNFLWKGIILTLLEICDIMVLPIEKAGSVSHERRVMPEVVGERVPWVSVQSYRQEDQEKVARKEITYTDDLPGKMYTFFRNYSDTGAPSFLKFATSVNMTLADIESFRTEEKFDRAYRECSEIRRDYLIDNGLTKRFDSSFTKFLLSTEFRMGEEKISDEERNIQLTLEVVGNEN